MQISISDLKLYLQCPRSYKLHVIDGLEPQYKSLSLCKAATVRKVMAKLHGNEKKPSDHTPQEIESLCEKIWQEEIANASQEELNTIVVQEKPATKKLPDTPAVTKGDRIFENIKTWCLEYSREEIGSQVLYSNTYFQIIIGDVTFAGHLDLLRKGPDPGIQVLIFNTSSQAPLTAYLARDFTLALPTWALWHGTLFPKYPDLSEEVRLKTIPSVYVYYLPYLERYQKKNGNHANGDRKGNPLIQVSKTKEELLDFEYEILYTVSGIQEEFFPMMPKSTVGCSVCQYAHGCDKSHSVFFDTSFDVSKFEEDVA